MAGIGAIVNDSYLRLIDFGGWGDLEADGDEVAHLGLGARALGDH